MICNNNKNCPLCLRSLLFYAGYKAMQTFIGRALLDGSNSETFDNLNVDAVDAFNGVVHVTVDYATDRLYFSRHLMNMIQSSNLDGTSVRNVSRIGVEKPTALTISEGKSDAHSNLLCVVQTF